MKFIKSMENKIKKLALSIALSIYIAIISGCFYESGPSLEEIMDSWLGAPVEKLIDSWGIPTKEYKVGDIIYLTYSSSKTITHTPTWFAYYSITSTTHTITCDKTMKIKDGIIISWTYRGHCGE